MIILYCTILACGVGYNLPLLIFGGLSSGQTEESIRWDLETVHYFKLNMCDWKKNLSCFIGNKVNFWGDWDGGG